jgi:Gpi18-like mannosyltransferase
VRNRFSNLTDSVIAQSLLLVVTTRLFLFGINWYSLRTLPPKWQEGSLAVGGWTRWDAGHYIRVATNGYAGSDDPGNPAFFPLFPMLMRGVAQMTGLELTRTNLGAIGMVITGLCFLIAVAMFARLVEEEHGKDVAWTSVLLLTLSPFSFFFSAVYTESLFLLLSTLVFMLASRQRWVWAAVCVGLASATRVTGLALAPALLLVAWRRGASSRELLSIVAISPLGILSFMAHTWIVLDNPLAFLTAQEAWGGWYERGGKFLELFLKRPQEIISGEPLNLVVALNVTLFVLALVCLPFIWRYINQGVALFTMLVIAQGATSWISLGRYLLPAIGVYVALVIVLARPGWYIAVRQMVVALSIMLLTMLTILFAHDGWVI